MSWKLNTLAAAMAVGLTLASGVTMPAVADTVASGQFEGRNKHVTTGTVKIERQGDRHTVVLERNFSLDGAPDPTLGFAKGGKFDKSTEFTQLKSNTGRQVYQLPASVDPSKFDEFVVWCSKYSLKLGVAKLK